MPTTNYDNRTVDLYLLGNLTLKPGTPAEEVVFGFGLEQDGGKICTGLLKLLQKVVILLLTYSRYFDTAWGSDLAGILGVGSMQKAFQALNASFPGIATNVIILLKAQESTDTPYDEQIKAIDLVDLSNDVQQGKIRLTIRVTSIMGENVVLTLPIAKSL